MNSYKFFINGFSLLSAPEFLLKRNVGVRNKKPPAMRVVQQVLIAPKSPFCYDRVVQATT